MNKIIDEIVFMIFDNNIIKNDKDCEKFMKKFCEKINNFEYDSINIEDTDEESDSSDSSEDSSDEDFINDNSESSDDDIDEKLEDEELKIIVKDGFSEIK